MQQLELFDIDEDNRVANLKNALFRMVHDSGGRLSSCKDIVAVGDKFGVVGRLPLTIYMRIFENYIQFLKEDAEDE